MTADETGPGRVALTGRQREIAALVARGYTNQQIAAEIVVSPGTAANHVNQILRRLGLGSRSELAAWASQRGLATAQNRMLTTLERLLDIAPDDLDAALDAAALAVADALQADKVDAFLHDPSTSTLVARGTSPTPLGRKQHALGLHLLPIANGGRMAEVFQTGQPHREGRVDKDTGELRGIRVELGIRSDISVPLEVAGERRGVLAAASKAADFFSEGDLRFLATVSRWVGMVAHRAELSQQATLEAAARTRRVVAEELVTVLAHDFRNFLTPLRGRLDLLERRLQREGQDRHVNDVQRIVGTVDRLDRLVRDLLDTARLDQGLFVLDRRPINLVELVRLTAAEIEPEPGAVHVEAPMEELVVSADTSRLRQLIENLLSNALKVQPEHQPVRVTLDTDGVSAILEVSDCGPGIASDVLSNLFQRFGAGSGSTGLGLGLYLARGIAEAHRGSLEVESQLGRGACFRLRLPLEGMAALVVPPRGSVQRNGYASTTAPNGG